jgi:hypothetical protein
VGESSELIVKSVERKGKAEWRAAIFRDGVGRKVGCFQSTKKEALERLYEELKKKLVRK